MRERGRKKAGGKLGRVGWKEREGESEEREGFGKFSFFSNLFKLFFFKLLKLNSFSNSKFKLSLTFQTFKTF
jgi:hypothetical protein